MLSRLLSAALVGVEPRWCASKSTSPPGLPRSPWWEFAGGGRTISPSAHGTRRVVRLTAPEEGALTGEANRLSALRATETAVALGPVVIHGRPAPRSGRVIQRQERPVLLQAGQASAPRVAQSELCVERADRTEHPVEIQARLVHDALHAHGSRHENARDQAVVPARLTRIGHSSSRFRRVAA